MNACCGRCHVENSHDALLLTFGQLLLFFFVYFVTHVLYRLNCPGGAVQRDYRIIRDLRSPVPLRCEPTRISGVFFVFTFVLRLTGSNVTSP